MAIQLWPNDPRLPADWLADLRRLAADERVKEIARGIGVQLEDVVTDVQAYKRATLSDLVDFIERFIRDNSRDGDVSVRWLAARAGALRLKALGVRNGQLSSDEKAAVVEFRLQEIETARGQRQREIDELNKEARQLSAAVSP